IGRQIVVPTDEREMPFEVIGVAADSRYRSVLDDPPLLMYVPLTQNYDSIARLMVAVDGPAGDFKDPLRQAVQQANRKLLTGIAIGVPLAAWAKPAVSGFLYGADGVNVLTFAGVAVLFLAVALVASAMPARRAAGIDPATALRCD